MMEIIFYLILAGIACFFLYHLAVAIFQAVKIQLKRADDLEKRFGKDIISAAKYTFGKDENP